MIVLLHAHGRTILHYVTMFVGLSLYSFHGNQMQNYPLPVTVTQENGTNKRPCFSRYYSVDLADKKIPRDQGSKLAGRINNQLLMAKSSETIISAYTPVRIVTANTKI
jgi:hypothetical protein